MRELHRRRRDVDDVEFLRQRIDDNPEAVQITGDVLVLASVTGGNQTVEVPAAKINLQFVLGNKVMVGTVNGNREYAEDAIRDLAMARAQYPGWAERLMTHPVQGLDNFRELIDTLTSGRDVIKAFCEIAPLDTPVGGQLVHEPVAVGSR